MNATQLECQAASKHPVTSITVATSAQIPHARFEIAIGRPDTRYLLPSTLWFPFVQRIP